jgi:Uma2 family endonuclease
MGQPAATKVQSVAEYLEWERARPDKHEYHRGEVFAMAGGSPRHNFLANAVGAELRAALRGKGCHVLSSDQQISARRDERYVYADAVVVCGKVELEAGTSDVLANPTVIVVVLSRSTAAYDRGEKWDAYQRLPSLADYLLVSQTAKQIEHYQRQEDGAWRYCRLEGGDQVVLGSGAVVAVDAIYEGAFELVGD